MGYVLFEDFTENIKYVYM